MSEPEGRRLDRLREFAAALSERDPVPGDAASEQAWDVWMNRVGADGDLAGLIASAIHGAHFHAAELQPDRAASETSGSRLDPDSVAEAFRLLAQRSV